MCALYFMSKEILVMHLSVVYFMSLSAFLYDVKRSLSKAFVCCVISCHIRRSLYDVK